MKTITMKSIFVLIIVTLFTLESNGQEFTLENQYLPNFRQLQKNEYINRLDSSTTYKFNSPTDSTLYTKRFNIYNDQGDLILYESRYTEIPSLNRREEMTYEENKEVKINFKFLVDDETWKESYKTETFYSNELEQSNIRYDWNAGIWEKDRRITFKYNDNNDVIEKGLYDWDSDMLIWQPTKKSEFTYNEAGKETLEEEFIFIDAEFQIHGKTETTYSNDLKTEVNEYIFEADQWVSTGKTEFNYDENDNMIKMLDYLYNKHVGEWDKENEINYTYYPDGSIKRFDMFIFDRVTSDISFTISFENFYDNTTNARVLTHHYSEDLTTIERKTFSYYTSELTSLNDNFNENITVYPNPSANSIFINSKTPGKELQLQLFSLSGKSVYENTVSSNELVELKDVPKGVLIYRISEKGKVIDTGKLIKK